MWPQNPSGDLDRCPPSLAAWPWFSPSLHLPGTEEATSLGFEFQQVFLAADLLPEAAQPFRANPSGGAEARREG